MGRPARSRHLPRALKDYVPSSVSALRRVTRHRRPEEHDSNTTAPEPDLSAGPAASRSPTPTHRGPVYEDREVDGFGLYRSYLVTPALETDLNQGGAEQCDDATLNTPSPERPRWWAGFGHGTLQAACENLFYPFLNATSFRLMHWFYSGSSTKSLSELDRLVSEVIMADDFNRDDLQNFNAAREARRLDNLTTNPAVSEQLSSADGWHHTNVRIRLPAEGVKHTFEGAAPVFDVPGLYYRKLMDVITSAFQDINSATWSMVPHRLWWQNPQVSPDDPPERVQTELYNSEAMVLEYEKLAARPRAPGDNLEIAIAGIMLWSDSTHLAQFGNASLWPIYLFFANQSKYILHDQLPLLHTIWRTSPL